MPSLFGALKRQSLVAGLLALPVLGLVIWGLFRWKPEFASSATLGYDPAKARVQQGEASANLANRINSYFYARFNDPDFLRQLADKLEADGLASPEVKPSSLKPILEPIMPTLFRPASWGMNHEELLAKLRVDSLQERLSFGSSPGQFGIVLTATGPTAAEAQQVARTAVRFFVEEEVKKQLAHAQEELARLNTLETSTLLEKANPSDIAKTQAFVAAEGVPSSELEKKEYKAKEQTLINLILAKQREAVRAQAIQYEKEFALQGELNALLSKRGTAHPDVVQKRAEIAKFQSEVPQLEAAIQAMKNQLLKLQAEMRARAVPIDRSVQILSFPEEVRRYLIEVSNQIRNTELQIEDLNAQLQDPARWSPYSLVKDAELPAKAANYPQLILNGLVGAALVLLAFGLIVIVREMRSPYLLEGSGVRARYNQSVLAELPARRPDVLNVSSIRRLRSQLASDKKDSQLAQFDGYRYLQQVIRAKRDPQVICFLDLGTQPSYLALNYANILATDSHERVIFLSFNPRNQSGQLPQAEGLMSFLAGEIDWKACRVIGADVFACDLAIAKQPEQQLGAFREDLVKRLVAALREKYQRIVIDGLNPVFITENSMLARESDSVVLVTPLGQSQHKEIERALVVAPADKVEGFVLS